MLFCFYPCILFFFGYWAVLGEMEEVGMWGLPLCCCSVWLIAARCVKARWSGWWGGCSTRPFNPTQSCWHRYAFPHPQNILSWTSNLKRYGCQYFSPSTPLSRPSAPHTNTRKADEPCLKKTKQINLPPLTVVWGCAEHHVCQWHHVSALVWAQEIYRRQQESPECLSCRMETEEPTKTIWEPGSGRLELLLCFFPQS